MAADAVKTIWPPIEIHPVTQPMCFLPHAGNKAVTQWYCPVRTVNDGKRRGMVLLTSRGWINGRDLGQGGSYGKTAKETEEAVGKQDINSSWLQTAKEEGDAQVVKETRGAAAQQRLGQDCRARLPCGHQTKAEPNQG